MNIGGGIFTLPRTGLYSQYQLMQKDPIISAALDVYADECLTKNQLGQLISIKTNDVYKKKILQNLLYDILNIQFNLWAWTRSLCKYGDFFLELKMVPKMGIVDYNTLSSYQVQRIQEPQDFRDPSNNNIQTTFSINGQATYQLKNYQMAHFRLLNDPNTYPYGKSILQGARQHWKKYTLLLDAVLIQRITRAPSKLVFNVDPGELQGREAQQYLEDMKARMRKISYVDKQGNIDLRYNVMNMLQDYWILKNSDSGTSIETLSGLDYNAIDDVLMFRNNMLAALKLPKAFLNFEQDLNSKATLSSQYIRFASTIQHIQAVVVNEIKKICIIHLYLQGYRGNELIDFQINLNSSSNIKQMQQIQLWHGRVDLATAMMQNKQFSRLYIYQHVYKMSKDQIKRQLKNIYKDAIFDAMLDKVSSGDLQDVDLQTGQNQFLNRTVFNNKDNVDSSMQQQIDDQKDVATDIQFDKQDPMNYKPQFL